MSLMFRNWCRSSLVLLVSSYACFSCLVSGVYSPSPLHIYSVLLFNRSDIRRPTARVVGIRSIRAPRSTGVLVFSVVDACVSVCVCVLVPLVLCSALLCLLLAQAGAMIASRQRRHHCCFTLLLPQPLHVCILPPPPRFILLSRGLPLRHCSCSRASSASFFFHRRCSHALVFSCCCSLGRCRSLGCSCLRVCACA